MTARDDRRAAKRFRHKAWRRFRTVAYLQGYDELCREWAPRLAAALMLLGCGGQVERDADSCKHTGTGLTAVSWCECLAMADGSTRCVALTDPKQLDECWWSDVVAVTASHPLSEDGTCEP